MLFHSQQFLLFFPVVFAIYWLLPRPLLRKCCLFVASCAFYMSWNAWFILLIFFTASVDYFAAIYIESQPKEKSHRRTLVLCSSITINLLLLFYFKYSNFFIANFCQLFQAMGFHTHKEVLDVVLPLGISFYTFETISYVVDVYRGTSKACRSLLDYSIFIMFFPHLIAGPIVRARDFLPQLKRPKKCTWADMTLGTQLFVLGLFKKVIVADYLAQVADPVFANPLSHSTGMAWLAALAYTGQIFCDFSGYSDMAIGLARMLGYRLKPNFNLPYLAVDIADFWRRWHISLSSWIRDYLYIPLGGNRGGNFRKHSNLLVTMFICGLWHGASWQFVAWGAYHGVLLVLNHFLKEAGLKIEGATRLISVPCTFLLVVFGWVLFRAPNLQIAMQLYRRMFHYHDGALLSPYLLICAAIALSLLAIGHMGSQLVARRRIFFIPPQAMAAGLSFLLLCVLIFRPEQRTQFIYFQF